MRGDAGLGESSWQSEISYSLLYTLKAEKGVILVFVLTQERIIIGKTRIQINFFSISYLSKKDYLKPTLFSVILSNWCKSEKERLFSITFLSKRKVYYMVNYYMIKLMKMKNSEVV